MTENYGGSGTVGGGGYGGGGSESDCRNWYASHDHMPGKPKTLYVSGKCTFPTAGYSVELKPASPQGKNPKIYLLDKIVHKPTGNVQQVITTVDVRYEEKTDNEYDQVTILPEVVTVDVEHTQ